MRSEQLSGAARIAAASSGLRREGNPASVHGVERVRAQARAERA